MITQTEKWNFFELVLSAVVEGNPFIDVDLEVTFAYKSRSITADGFYDGDNVFKARFMPDATGMWQYETHSNVDELNGITGEFECIPPSKGSHGPVRVIDSYHFAYEDGTPYHPIGTTCYAWNHQGDELEQQTLKTLNNAPFNKMRMCVFPKRYRFNTNEPPLYPFEGEVTREWDESQVGNHRAQPPHDFWDLDRFNPEYFRKLEGHILDLRDLGIEADLIIFHPYDFGAWGFDQLPAEINDRYLKYLTARLAAFRNVWWSFANEFDFMPHLDANDWDHFFKVVQVHDPFDHLRSIHNGYVFYDHTKPWVTHCSVQSGDFYKMPEWLLNYKKPVVVDECGYEGDIECAWGSLSAEALVECFWSGFTCGGYVGHGETYWNEENVLWWSKGGQLTGEGPARIAFLREIIEDVPQPGLSPFLPGEERQEIMPDGVYKGMVAGHKGEDYYLLYLARNQPRFRRFDLPEDKTYKIDIIDTWNMTITTFAENVSGEVTVELPRQNYLAVRIQRND